MSEDSMVKQMEKHLGIVGRPNVITKAYAKRNGAYFANAAWCNMTITEAARASGNYQEVCFGKDFAYTVWHAQEFKRRGQWHTDTAGIRRGDIVFFDWDGSDNIAHIDHIGIVTDVNGRDVLTIEGNTSDRCARRVRHSDTIAGYGRPKYKVDAPAKAPATVTVTTAVNEYRVLGGDTLSKIGQKLGVRWQDIAKLNGLRSPYTIHPGDLLRLPGRPPAKK